MRMKELEARTGVNRETIRFYIREGLLPSPDRTGLTAARYSEDHVVKVRAIRKLQDERHLPLSAIRGLIANGNAQSSYLASVFPELEADLNARLAQRSTSAERVDLLAKRIGYTPEDFAALVAAGIVQLHRAEDGRFWVQGCDVVLAERCAALKAAGFNGERGFGPQTMQLYLEFTQWLVSEEIRMFVGNVAGKGGAAELVNMAERGIDIMNEVLSLLRTRTIQAKMQDLRAAWQSEPAIPTLPSAPEGEEGARAERVGG